MYRLCPSPGYAADLEAIEAESSSLLSSLERGAYHILQRNPQSGSYSATYDAWFIRHRVIGGLLMVQILYRIREDCREVDLIAVRQVDLTIL